MSRVLLFILSVVVALGVARPASADLTAFVGATQSPSSRTARGAAIGLSLAIVGFEVEYSDTSEGAGGPGLQSTMFNLVVQTPFAISRLQFYGTIGGGMYRERLAGHRDTGFGSNFGVGVKISLVGPIRARIDYRTFRLGDDSTGRTPHRVYAGLNIAF